MQNYPANVDLATAAKYLSVSAITGLDPADWDEAKRVIAEEEARRERELIELAERYE